MLCPHDALMEGIGRALDNTFEGHWWGIGGHWRALVKKRHTNAYTVAYDGHNEKHRKTYENHGKHHFNDTQQASIFFRKILGI